MCNLMPNEKELIEKFIDQFTNLQRIMNADDTQKEIAYQLQITKAKLESLGIHTTDLEMN